MTSQGSCHGMNRMHRQCEDCPSMVPVKGGRKRCYDCAERRVEERRRNTDYGRRKKPVRSVAQGGGSIAAEGEEI